MSGEPFPKSKQLARGAKRYRRFVASAKQWAVLQETKQGPCRVCHDAASNGRFHSRIVLHHVIPRDHFGDDYAANLVPLCPNCHALVHRFDKEASKKLLASLTDSEYAYAVGKAGEGFAERIYGLVYER